MLFVNIPPRTTISRYYAKYDCNVLTRVNSSYIMRSLDDKTIEGDKMITIAHVLGMMWCGVMIMMIANDVTS